MNYNYILVFNYETNIDMIVIQILTNLKTITNIVDFLKLIAQM